MMNETIQINNSNEEKRARLILVDDHAVFRFGLVSMLSPLYQIVGEADSAEALFELLSTQRPHLVLLDIILPGMSGVEAARRLKSEYRDVKVLMLSSENSDMLIKELISIGVEGFVSKSAPISLLKTAVESVLNGVAFYGRDIARIIHDVHVSQIDKPVDFTSREKEVLRYCAQGLTSREIAEAMFVSRRTIENHKAHIFAKLGINNSLELLDYAKENGIRFL